MNSRWNSRIYYLIQKQIYSPDEQFAECDKFYVNIDDVTKLIAREALAA